MPEIPSHGENLIDEKPKEEQVEEIIDEVKPKKRKTQIAKPEEIQKEVLAETENGFSLEDKTEVSFPDTRQIALKYFEKYFSGDEKDKEGILGEIGFAIDAAKTGKLTYIASKQLSKKTKSPVLQINNARGGAFFQYGTPHWLSCFNNEADAKEFLDEIQGEHKMDFSTKAMASKSYREGEDRYKQAKRRLLTVFIAKAKLKNPDFDIAKAEQMLEEKLRSIEFEIEATDERLLGSTDTYGEPKKYWDKSTHKEKEFESAELDLDGQEYETYQTVLQSRDAMREAIFYLASEWLKEGKLDHFVYPVNHFKYSSSPTGYPREEERLWNSKFGKTVAHPNSKIVFCDAAENNVMNNAMRKAAQSLLKKKDDFKFMPLSYPFAEDKKAFSNAEAEKLDIVSLRGVREAMSEDLKYVFINPSYPSPSRKFDISRIAGNWRLDPSSTVLSEVISDIRKEKPFIKNLYDQVMEEPNHLSGASEREYYLGKKE